MSLFKHPTKKFFVLTTAVAVLFSCHSQPAIERSAQLATEQTRDIAASRVPAPLALNKKLDLNAYRGFTFFQFMSGPGAFKAQLDQDAKTEFVFADRARIMVAAQNFEPEVVGKLMRIFAAGEKGMDALIEGLAGQKTTPIDAPKLIGSQLRKLNLAKSPDRNALNAVMLAPFLGLSSGAGTLVLINQDNYFYNYGYKSGADERDVKSGRSFGTSPGHRSLDPSDNYYLDNLQKYLTETPDPTPFYTVLLEVLTGCNTVNYSRLSPAGQMVLTDFIAIYAAEMDRHLMANLKMHAWENDLAEVTFLSAYGNRSGLVQKDGKLMPGVPRDYFAVGNDGSGIGVTRKDRMNLQAKVTSALRMHMKDIVEGVERFTGPSRSGDVMHGFMLYLNDPKNQEAVRKNAPALVQAMAKYLAAIRGNAEKLTLTLK